MEYKQRQKILYGAGEMGKRAFEHYTKADPDAVYCFVDTYKGGQVWCGKPVISFDEFVAIHKDYDVVICIFNLLPLIPEFAKAEVYVFTVWEDVFTVPIDERKREYFQHMRKLDDSFDDKRPKILYGAGYYGEEAFSYYGADRVYAFADRAKSGSMLLGKPVLRPDELPGLQEDYEIVVCVQKYNRVVNALADIGVIKTSLYIRFEDVRTDLPQFNRSMRGTMSDPDIIEEIKDLDFIRHPEYIDEYYTHFIKGARRVDTILPDSERIATRILEENKVYGYFAGVRQYADRDVEYYEAPSVCHGCYLQEVTVALRWRNLIEPGDINRASAYNASFDCLYFKVGPYLQYVESFYNQREISKQREKNGKTLTIYPSHSSALINVGYDARAFLEAALQEAKRFDSLTVSTYITDYNSETVQLFRANGAHIVSAGFPSDPSFARRLKSIILLSDAIFTNSLGSHLCFATGLNKPTKFFSQRYHTYNSVFDSSSHIDAILNHELGAIIKAFEVEDYRITQEQRDVLMPSSDFSVTKTKEEMGAIFDLSKRIVQNCGYKRSRYVDSLRSTYRELQRATAPEEKLQFRLMSEALPVDYEEHLKSLGL